MDSSRGLLRIFVCVLFEYLGVCVWRGGVLFVFSSFLFIEH